MTIVLKFPFIFVIINVSQSPNQKFEEEAKKRAIFRMEDYLRLLVRSYTILYV